MVGALRAKTETFKARVAGGEPPMDLWPVDIRRFGQVHRDKNWVLTRTLEAYAHHYSMAWPHEELESVRPVRVSPLYAKLKEQGAVFGWKLGWERPNWFAPKSIEPKDVYSYERQNWFDHVGNEHKAARERVVLIDQTSFAKFMLVGRDAEAALTWIASNDVAKKPGTIIYTQMLNQRGGIECDLTVTRVAEDAYYIVTGLKREDGELRVLDHTRREAPLTFTAETLWSADKQPDPADPIAQQLAQQHPGARCVRLTSDQAVACQQQPGRILELSLDSERLVSPLPLPSVRSLAREDLLYRVIKHSLRAFQTP